MYVKMSAGSGRVKFIGQPLMTDTRECSANRSSLLLISADHHQVHHAADDLGTPPIGSARPGWLPSVWSG
jgi:hypothetical protein